MLLLLPTTTYRTPRLSRGGEAPRARRHRRPPRSRARSPAESRRARSTLDFRDPAACARRIAALSQTPADRSGRRRRRGDGRRRRGDFRRRSACRPTRPGAAVAAWHKPTLRRRLRAAGVGLAGASRSSRGEDDPAAVAARVRYPCVLKPTFLSGSRGVIRADDPAAFVRAWGASGACSTIRRWHERGGKLAREIVVEDFVAGPRGLAVEGLLRGGRPHGPGALRQAGSARRAVLRGDDLRDAVAPSRVRRSAESARPSPRAPARSASSRGPCTPRSAMASRSGPR